MIDKRLTVLIFCFAGQILSQNLSTVEPDLCTSVDPTIIDDKNGHRSPLKSSGASICDSNLPEQWYRILSPHGDDMPTSGPEKGACGTEHPIWLNGSLPEISDGVITEKACVISVNDSCLHEIEIKIMNCTHFMLYRLLPTGFCPSAYCFGTKIIPTEEPTTMDPDTTTNNEKRMPTCSFVMIIFVSALNILISVTS